MKKMLYAIMVVCGMCGISKGMNVQEIIQKQIGLYYPTGSTMVLQPSTVESFVRDSDSLYMSIDEFRDPIGQLKNTGRFSDFIMKYFICAITQPEYRNILTQDIMPQFKQFTDEDAACETAGLYSDEQVVGFVKILKERLNILFAINMLGTMASKGEQAND
ncbi:MAG: hypothetical protein LBB21_07300 [Holosporaceae bacterium]|nr:hypothetical protein [Holosporaceae bacterium]